MEKNEAIETLFTESHELTIRDKTYKMRDLTIEDVYGLGELVKKSIVLGYADLELVSRLTTLLEANGKLNYQEIAAGVLGMTAIRPLVYDYVGSIIYDPDTKEFLTGNQVSRLPASSIIDLVVAFCTHPEFVSFLANLSGLVRRFIPGLMKSLTEMNSKTQE